MSPTRTIRRKIDPGMRYQIYAMDGYQCVYCGVNLRHVVPAERTLDHVRPISRLQHPRHKKEVNHPSNLVTCCVPCNRQLANNTTKMPLKYGRYGAMALSLDERTTPRGA